MKIKEVGATREFLRWILKEKNLEDVYT